MIAGKPSGGISLASAPATTLVDYVGMDEHQEESRSKQRWRPPEREQYVLKHERFIISNVRRCEINHQRSLGDI